MRPSSLEQVEKTTVRDATNKTVEESTYNPDGTLAAVRIKNAAGDTVTGTDYTYTYTATGQSIASQVLNGPVTTVQTYDLRGRLVKEEAQTEGETLTTTYEYDYLENVISTKDARANAEGWGNTTQTVYDYAGNVLSQTNALGKTMTNTYNLLGQLVSSSDYKGNATTYVYDKMGRNIQITTPFDGTNVSKKFVIYDKNGNVIREKQQNNAPGEGETYRCVEYEYDSKNRLTAVKQYDGETEYKTAYTYDNAGNQTSIITGANTAGPHTTSYTYNKLGQVVSETDAMGGVKTAAYDYLGNVTGGLTKAGETITNTYNDWNLPVLQTVTSTNPDTGETNTDTRSYTYDNLGRKTSATNETGTATYEYDDFGRLIKETDVTGAVKEYTYDENGNRKTFKLTVGGTQQMDAAYTYDQLNQLASVTIGGDTTTYGYDDNGNILNKQTGELVTAYTYNSGNMLTNMETNQGSNSLYTYTSSYYLDGNKQTANDGGTVSQYQYNGLGQLLTESQGTDVFGYTYDAYGNRAGKTAQGASETTAYTYNANNQLLKEAITHGTEWMSSTQYTYDANGNQISKLTQKMGNASGEETVQMGTLGEEEPAAPGIAFYTYNGFGEMTGIQEGGTTAFYTYSPDGLRVSKTVNGETTTHILDGANVVADIQGTSISKYNRGRGLISIEQGGNKGYYVFNGHGDVLQIRNASGEQVYRKMYDAFGIEIESYDETNQFANPFGYAGEYTDEETGNIYLRARYYNPNTGRFLIEDPIKDGTNWYAYAGNNPVLFLDPWGLAAGDFYVNGNKIGYVSKWETGTYGSARDYTEAMGGSVDTSNSNYRFTIGNLVFILDGNTKYHEYAEAYVYDSNIKKNVGTVRYTVVNDVDNPGAAKMILNLDDISSICNSAGYGATYVWDLGTEGGSLERSFGFYKQIDAFIPTNSVKEHYYPDGKTASIVGQMQGVDNLGAAIGAGIAGIIIGEYNQAQFERDINSGARFIQSQTQFIATGGSENYFWAYNSTMYGVQGGNIGYFYAGQYLP